MNLRERLSIALGAVVTVAIARARRQLSPKVATT